MNMVPINPAVIGGATTAKSATQQAAVGEDFAAMLMQMFGGGATGTGDLQGLLGTDDSLMQYAQQLVDGTVDGEELTKDGGTDNAMQLMAALFMATPADVSFVQSPLGYKDNTAQHEAALQRMSMLGTALGENQSTAANINQLTPEQLVTFAQTATPEQLSQMLGNTASNTTTTGTATDMSRLVAELTTPQTNALDPKLAALLADANATSTAVKSSNAQVELDPLMSAYNRLYGIQKPAETSGKTENTLDIEALQQAVDNGTYLNPSIANLRDIAQAVEQVTPRDIAAQVQTGILANLDKGQQEFVIKLKPEGLGDITVKLVENAGKISLSIITSTQQAHSALSSEISSLREALRPFNAEITQLVANDQSAFAQQQSMGEHRHDGHQGEQQHRGGRFWEPEDNTPVEDMREYAQHLHTALSAHV